VRVIERTANGGADRFLTLETGEKGGVVLHFRVRDFDGDGQTAARIGGSKNRSHSAAGNNGLNEIVIEPVARLKGADQECSRARSLL
jgi:hypothetical protein